MISNPDLLVLDEPTVAMDVEVRREFWTSMREFASRGKTVVFATHYLEEADTYADRIVLMARGRIVADGPATEIKATVGLRTIRATLPDVPVDDAYPTRGCAERGAAAARPSSCTARTPTPRSARLLSAISRPLATSRSPAPGSKRRSSC